LVKCPFVILPEATTQRKHGVDDAEKGQQIDDP
jgi:hypothetical protein